MARVASSFHNERHLHPPPGLPNSPSLAPQDAQGLDDKQLKIAYCIVGILCDLQVIVGRPKA